MANELKPWKYDIQYGPEGEANYAWVYDDHGAMVATMKTHKAKEIVERMNTRRAAPVEGLETVHVQFRMTDSPKRPWGNGPIPEHLEGYAIDRELVTRSQAEAIIAAKEDAVKARINYWSEHYAQQHDRAEKAEADKKIWMEKAAIEAERVSNLEADNAALTARVKELEHSELVKGVNTQYANALAYLEMTEDDDPEEFAKRVWDERETLKTQLAAAAEENKKLKHDLAIFHKNNVAILRAKEGSKP